MLLHCTRRQATSSSVQRTVLSSSFSITENLKRPAALTVPPTKFSKAFISHSARKHNVQAQGEPKLNKTPFEENLDTPLPHQTLLGAYHHDAPWRFEDQKQGLLASIDLLQQVQDAPAEKTDTTAQDLLEAAYWARRLNSALNDLDSGHANLQVAIVGETIGQEPIMDLLLPSISQTRRSAKDTGKVHRVRYGSDYRIIENGQENIEEAPISWLEGLSGHGGELVEIPNLDLDDLVMDDLIYNSDLVVFRTDSIRQLALSSEQRFLNRYRHKSNIIVVSDIITLPQDASEPLLISTLQANLSRAARLSHHLLSTPEEAEKVLRVSNPDNIPIIVPLYPASISKTRHDENVGTLQVIVAKLFLETDPRLLMLSRCRDLISAAVVNAENRLEGRVKVFEKVDELSQQVHDKIEQVKKFELERMMAQVTDGKVDKDVAQMHGVLNYFFEKEVPFWMLVARSGEIEERLQELWTEGAFVETEHRMAYALGRLHQSSQDVFRSVSKSIDILAQETDRTVQQPGRALVLQDLKQARDLLETVQANVQKGVSAQDAFVVSNVVWKHRSSYNTELAGGQPGVIERLQRRGQVALAQGLGLQGTALATGVGLAQQFPPEVFASATFGLSVFGMLYMQQRWKAAEKEFVAEADVLAEKLKQDILDTYEHEVETTIVEPLTAVVDVLDKNLSERLARSMEQRKVLHQIRKDASGREV